MTLLRGVRASGTDPVLVSGGDFLFAMGDYRARSTRRQQLLEKAKVIVDSYNRFGYVAAALAECDLALGIDAVLGLQKSMSFSLLCANLVHERSETPIFPASVVVERAGRKIAIIGVLQELTGPFLGNVAPGMKLLDPLTAVRREVERLSPTVDMIFLLGHLDRTDVDKVADEIPGVDFILEPNSYSGSTAIWIPDDKEEVARNGRLLLKVSGQGSAVGRLDVHFRGKGLPWQKQELMVRGTGGPGAGNTYVVENIELAPHFGEDVAIKKMMDAFRRSTRYVRLEAEDAEWRPSNQFLTVENCQACHPEQTAFWRQTAHARAYETLEKSGDEYRYDCLPCHVLGYGETFIDAHRVEKFKDVQCESCHGVNPKHPADPVKIKWKRPGGKLVDDKPCWGCHNPKVTRAPFNPTEAIPQIACPPMQRD